MSVISTTASGSALFPAKIESEIFNKVKGHSSLAKLSAQDAIPFVGKDIFTFSNAKGIQVVGENAEKAAGVAAVSTVAIRPLKVVYQQRFSDEFMYASEEYQLNVLQTFADAYAAAIGAGLDKMALHGIEPYSGALISGLATSKYFDGAITTNVVQAGNAPTDTSIDSAVNMVTANEYIANGCAIGTTIQSAIASLSANGLRKYPDFAFGAVPTTLGNMTLDLNATVEAQASDGTADKMYAIVGDFQNAFKWGIAKDLPLEIIQYGDPDNTGVDLKGSNQICLRSEAYIGWGILDTNAFSIVNAHA